MAVGYETNTQIQNEQLSTEPNFLYHVNDRDFTAANDSSDKPWHEVAVIDNGNHTRTLLTRQRPANDHPVSLDDGTPYDRSTPSSYLVADQTMAERLYGIQPGLVYDAMKVLGYSTEKHADTLSVTYHDLASKNARLDWIRQTTGYAPSLVRGHEGLYTNEEQTEALEQYSILLSASPEDEEHDAITHELAWELLAPSTFNLIASRSRKVLDDFQAASIEANSKTESSDALNKVTKKLSSHFDIDLERGISSRLVLDLSDYLGPAGPKQIAAEYNLVTLFTSSIFGEEDMTDEQFDEARAVARAELLKTVDHIRTLAELKSQIPS